jgi:hypothetical protein
MRFIFGFILAVVPHLILAQSSRASASKTVVGTYREHDAVGAGCTIEVGEPKEDIVRVQFDCNRGAPSNHHGAGDDRLLLRAGVATYASHNASGVCTIRFAFDRERVHVTQRGRDLACGFGAFVKIDGTYPRVSRRPPKFDLLPL